MFATMEVQYNISPKYKHFKAVCFHTGNNPLVNFHLQYAGFQDFYDNITKGVRRKISREANGRIDQK